MCTLFARKEKISCLEPITYLFGVFFSLVKEEERKDIPVHISINDPSNNHTGTRPLLVNLLLIRLHFSFLIFELGLLSKIFLGDKEYSVNDFKEAFLQRKVLFFTFFFF